MTPMVATATATSWSEGVKDAERVIQSAARNTCLEVFLRLLLRSPLGQTRINSEIVTQPPNPQLSTSQGLYT